MKREWKEQSRGRRDQKDEGGEGLQGRGKDCKEGGREQEEAVKARVGCKAERNLKKWEV